MIEFNAEQIKKSETLLGGIKDALPRAQSNAINRSLTSARAEAVRSVTKDYIIAAGEVRKTMVIKNANPSNPLGAIRSSGSPIALSKFDINPKRPGKRVAVTVRVKRSGGRKPIKKAFVAGVGSGHTGVFVRAGKARYPLKQLYGPSIPQMVGNENVMKSVEEKATETLDKRLEHEINRILEGHL
ncbi:hypothetical protein SPSIL_009020 [Sporomusa silvacetica DSM 10669]|uniref:Prophage minor tail protein Z n=1 Tax=Sporomusa silvacetica DSM 10669 TaxID=1123289 RepID=A0ABZ3IH96_9FIRM|nr:phage tail protein [Sporomusa silvacetica]OZC13138.1 prophage minor tail protein Z [Sporomusa silvacetica DSM 10669]